MRLLSCLFAALVLPACSTVTRLSDAVVYKLPTRQGNVMEQKDIDKLRLGMTRDQVKFVLGTPIATNPFRDDRWNYFGYYKSPRGEISQRNMTLFFESGKLARMEGVQVAEADSAQAKAVDVPDLDTLTKEKKAESDRARDENPAGVPNETQLPSTGGPLIQSPPPRR